MRNTIQVTVTFNDRLKMPNNTPTFLSLFDRIPEIKNGTAVSGVAYQFNTNHSHKGAIERMYNVFGVVSSISFHYNR